MHLVLYDADCGFCQLALRRFGWLLRREVRAQPLQTFVSAEARLQTSELEKAITLVLNDGRTYTGAEAIARAIGGPGRLYFVPGIRQCADFAYNWVARNRHKLPGGCAVTSGKPD